MRELSDFKDSYYSELTKFYEAQQGTVKRPWTKQKVFEVILNIKNAKVSMEAGVRRTSAEYYWYPKYDYNEHCWGGLSYFKENPDSPTARIINTLGGVL